VHPQRRLGEATDEVASVVTLSWGPTLTERGRRLTRPTPPAARRRGSAFLRYLLVGLDAAALTVSWVIATALVSTSARSPAASVFTTLAFVAGGLAVFSAMGLYLSRVCILRTVEYAHIASGCLIAGVLALAISAVSGIVTPIEIAFGITLAFLLAIVLRSVYRTWLTSQRRFGRHLRSVLLFGAGNEAARIVGLLEEHPELGYRTTGVVGNELQARRNGLKSYWCGELDDGITLVAETAGTGAIICADDLRSSQLNELVQHLLKAGTHVHLSSGLQGIDVGRLRPSPLAYEPFFYVEHASLASWQLVTKRAIDIVLSSIILILTLPILGLAALGIKLQDFGPVVFKQYRIGRQGAPFMLYKLRTMREGAESETDDLLELNVRNGPLTKLSRDPRATKLGRILRATSIDELPQLWNVINGTMSLVGPRPALPAEAASFDDEHRARESVWPGITGLWQVEGRDNPYFGAYRRFDLFYLQNWSIALDLMILLITVESVIARVFRALRHLDEDIALVPPLVLDPGRVTTRAARGHEGKIGSSGSATRMKGEESVL